MRRHEDLMVPVATLPIDETPEGDVARLHDLGYRGLKIIGSRLPIDDPGYFPHYAAAEERRMPILFHLGVIGGGVDYSVTHPRRDPEAAAALRRMGRVPPPRRPARRVGDAHAPLPARHHRQQLPGPAADRRAPRRHRQLRRVSVRGALAAQRRVRPLRRRHDRAARDGARPDRRRDRRREAGLGLGLRQRGDRGARRALPRDVRRPRTERR